LLNEAGGRFFGQLDAILWEDLLLHLCRMTDRTRAGGYEQLTVRRLPQLFTEDRMVRELKSAINKAVRATKFARDWRDRHIGHRSRARALDPSARPLAPASRAHVVKALDRLSSVLQIVFEARFGGGMDFSVAGGSGDAEDVLSVVQLGVLARNAREARFASGELIQEDYNPHRAL
jgi:hypothetical protein